MSDIFISYARSTAKQAQAVAEALQALGYRVWRDDDLPAHRSYAEVIDERLRAAKAVVVIWSAEAVKSQWVRAEADFARQSGTLVQLAIDGTVPPLPFNQIQCADMNGWGGDVEAPGWRKVVASVAELVGRTTGQILPTSPPSGPVLSVSAISASASPLLWFRRPMVLAAAALFVLVLAVGATAFFVLRAPAPPPSTVQASSLRVAVLPFEAIGTGSGARTFADTLADAIADALSDDHVETLANTDRATLRGPDAQGQITRLGIGLLLDGVVRSDGQTLSVRVHLDDALRNVTIWSKTFAAPVQDADALRTRIAANAALVSRMAVSPTLNAIRSDPSLLGAYLDAYEKFQLSFGRSARSLAILRDVVARAPTFSRGHSLLAAAVRDNSAGLPDDVQLHAVAEADNGAKLALSLDPRNGQAWSMLASDTPLSAWRERENFLLKGLAVDPNEFNLRKYFQRFLNSTGRNREAVEQGQQTLATERFFVGSPLSLAHALAIAGRVDEAAATMADAKKLWPDNVFLLLADFQVAIWSGQSPRQVLALLDNPTWRVTVGPKLAVDFWRTYFKTLVDGDTTQKRAEVRMVENAVKAGSIELGDGNLALTQLGDLDAAFQAGDDGAIQRRLKRVPAYFSQIAVNGLFAPPTAPLRQDRRFMTLAASLGLVDYWRTSGHWPDFCSEPGLPYDCRAEAARLTKAPRP